MTSTITFTTETSSMQPLPPPPPPGYLYNVQTKEVYTLAQGTRPVGGYPEVGEYLMFKLGVLTTSLFVLFTSTMSVSYTLRETQSRMLRFTVHLQHHARHRLPTFRLITLHVLESLVFVPVRKETHTHTHPCCVQSTKYIFRCYGMGWLVVVGSWWTCASR